MTTLSGKTAKAVVSDILEWYDHTKRPLPWRQTSDPYCIWVSEMMLQQTQVDTVIPYYHRFMSVFPSIDALARAPFEEVLKTWENLGYYSRARHLHTAARRIMEQFGGRLPDTEKNLRTLPGVGPYTAGAILSIAYGQAIPAVDGNVRRILCRLLAVQEPADQRKTIQYLQQAAARLVPRKRPGDFNQALMDLGASICQAKRTACTICPIAAHCRARETGMQRFLPIISPKAPVPHRQAVAAIIRNKSDHILMVQRPASGLLASLWTLPGGFVQEPCDMETALQRLLIESLNMPVRVGPLLASLNHAYTHFRITLHAYGARIMKNPLRLQARQPWLWASVEILQELPLSKIDRMAIRAVSGPDKKTQSHPNF